MKKRPVGLDATDRKLLALPQEDVSLSVQGLAERVMRLAAALWMPSPRSPSVTG